MTVTACSWATSKWPHLSDEGDQLVLLRASVGRADAPQDLEADDDEIVATVVEDLARTMALQADPQEARVNRWPRSFPQYAPGHLERVADIERRLADCAPSVLLTGAAYRGLGVPACIRQANEVAERILSDR